ncbi:MAG: glycosyltransferase family 4 protein [Rhodocyclaceae bacterium]|nr:glycosyltransferase family 4 protein [Rhodocyclaceae bacterium]MBX3667394.1 glycosyltransferase family 4 protein [Rhodocyclaceae bacterium]
MKLAVIRQVYNPFGGAERFVERAVAAMRDEGLEVGLVARRWAGTEQPGQAFLRCDPFYIGRLWRDAGFANAALARARAAGYELVQSHERIPGCDIFRAGDGVHATWLDLRRRVLKPYAAAAQTLSPWHRYTAGAEARMFGHARLAAVICNSHMVRDDIARRFGVADSKLHVIYNGLDLERFSPALRAEHRAGLRAGLNVAPDEMVYLFVGSGFARKGVPQILQAAQTMRVPARFWIVGADKQLQPMQNEARARGLGNRVQFFGPQKDVRPYLGAADAFVLPSLYDPFPNAALEALASGLPAIVSSTCGAAEFIRSGNNGYCCDALDIATLAARLDDLAEPGAAPAMRAAARRSVEHLSVQALAQQLIALYRKLL